MAVMITCNKCHRDLTTTGNSVDYIPINPKE